MAEQDFKIPKIAVPIICHTEPGEKLAGEIFLDVLSSEGYSARQVLDFFNTHLSFFPFRPSAGRKPLLLLKESVIQVDVPEMMKEMREDTSLYLAQKKEVILYLHKIGPVRAVMVLDLPSEYARVIDLLNQNQTFFPAVVNETTFALMNSHHIYKIEEL